MKKVAFLSLLVAIVLVSCNGGNSGFKTSKTGMKYKIMAGSGKDSLLKKGDLVAFSVTQKLGDSLAFNSYEGGHQTAQIDTAEMQFNFQFVFKYMKVGDSAMVRVSADSIYETEKRKASAQDPKFNVVDFNKNVPPFYLKKGNYINIGVKVLDKFTMDSNNANYAKDTARYMTFMKDQRAKAEVYQAKMQKKMKEEQDKKDKEGNAKSSADFEKLIKEKGATWKKTPSGAYVEVLTAGTGAACTLGKVAELRYSGSLLSNGNIFDGNIKGKARAGDTATKPLLPVGIGGPAGEGMKVITGLDEGLQLLSMGAKANVYIPSAIGYGGQSQGPDLPAYSNLKFYIEVENVKEPTKVAAPKDGGRGQQLTPEQMEQIKKQMAQQGQQ